MEKDLEQRKKKQRERFVNTSDVVITNTETTAGSFDLPEERFRL